MANKTNEKQNKKRRKIRIAVKITAISLFIILIDLIILFQNGSIWTNDPEDYGFLTNGFLVSAKNGANDWEKISHSSMKFVFIKSTEGSIYSDADFLDNWKNVKKTDLEAGAYHTFSLDVSGEKQAQNFISKVGDLEGMLLPMVEFIIPNDISNEEIIENSLNELSKYIDVINNHYGASPLIYTNTKTYKTYIKEYIKDSPIVLESVMKKVDKDISFWAFSKRGKLSGVESKFVSLLAFKGKVEDLYSYKVKKPIQ